MAEPLEVKDSSVGGVAATPGLRRISLDLFRLSWPAILSNALSQTCSIVTLMYVSSFDDKYLLGAIGLGSMAQNVFGFSLGRGLNAALDMLVSQSNGAGNFTLCSHYLRQAQTVSLLITVPAVAALFFSERFFVAIGIDEQTAQAAGRYVQGTLPSMPFYFLYNATRSFLRGMKIASPDSYVNLAVAVVHPLWCYLLLSVLKLGALGAGLTISISYILSFLFLTGYVLLWSPAECRRAWQVLPWPSHEPVGEDPPSLCTYLKVAIPTALLIWSEWWVFEIMSLLAGIVGASALAAHTAACNVLLVAFMVPLGLGNSATNLIGNALGQGDARQARRATSISMLFVVVLSTCMIAFLLAVRRPIARLFSTDEEVLEMIMGILVPMAPFLMCDSVQTVLEGVLRGLGLQRSALFAKLFAMFGFRVGGAILFAFQLRLGVAGIWWGGLTGMGVTVLLYSAIFLTADVEKITSGVRQAMLVKDSQGD